MAEQFYTILTNQGKAKIANTTALGTKVNLTKFQVGDGNGAYYNPIEEQRELKHKVWEGNVNSITVSKSNPNWIVLETIIPGDVGGFMIREAAVLDDEGNMIAVGKYPETYKPVVADGSTKDLIIKMILEVSNTSSVTLKVDPTVILATHQDIENLKSQIDESNKKIDNIELTAEKITIKDSEKHFKSKNIEDALKELFIYADNVKKHLNTTLSLSADSTFEDIKNKLDKIIKNIKTYSLNFSNGRWEEKESANSASQFGCTAYNDKIYIFGGFKSSAYVREAKCYNPITNKWKSISEMPTHRFELGVAVSNNKIYCIGGYNGDNPNGNYLNTNECYDPLTNTWTTKSPMPTARGYLRVENINNKIYCIGGILSYGNIVLANECYDPLTNTWTTKSPMPTARKGFGWISCNNKIYCIGGYNSNPTEPYLNTNECYDPLTNTWTTKSPMPTKRMNLSVGSVDNKIYCIAGINTETLDINECYNPLTNTWTTKTPISTANTYCNKSPTIDGNIYVLNFTSTFCFNHKLDNDGSSNSLEQYLLGITNNYKGDYYEL